MTKNSVLESLQRGTVPPPGRNGCTFIPGRGGAPCTTQRNFAGRHVVPPPPVYPDDQVISVGVLLLISMQRCEAIRVVNEVKKEMKMENYQSLQRAPVHRPGDNGCTFIPGRGGAPCTNQRNFAGQAMAAPLPHLMIHLGAADN
ncbi:hypothetical protein JRO89_XS01G0279300 [Xanthoceras sorbifolium]|uniref:Uncharacterized protein n=1 Tax=Xanthoceras sorbifolium TaxID=99658 RepID=A0ABQ8ILR6_9ROSI|nr:hypothetical protein JRO89_XS01G0279300 [Xanthoceras sorbifolium]